MKWKRVVGLTLLALVVAALIYPGIPFGSRMESGNQQTDLTCYTLHWYGIHSKKIIIRHDPDGSYSVTNLPCWKPPY